MSPKSTAANASEHTMKLWRFFTAFIIITYAVVGVLTLPNYGVNWDEINHSTRGQAYLNYFLTGQKSYNQRMFESGRRTSFYQMPGFDFSYQMKKDGDHPVLSDILSSFFNVIFYQKLGILGDFDAYHLYGIVLVTLFLIFLYFWVERAYGGFTGFISVLSLVLYPLFYGESHFNVQKDIPETVYMTATALAFYTAYTQRSVRWMIATGVLAGAALGTKLNVVFLIPSVGIWVFFLGLRRFFRYMANSPRKFLVALLFASLIAVGIFYGSWPWLWQNPIGNLAQSLGYYRRMGIVSVPALPTQYYVFGLNTYALQWILFTTPVVTLLLSLIGMLSKANYYILILFLLPIARVSFSFTSMYGGVRQIMEYVPAMAILAGIGAQVIVTSLLRYFVTWKKISKKNKTRLTIVLQVMVILSFVPITLKMIKMHPNESIYFNPLIGGLKGAAVRNIPGWGNSLGSTYRQGVRWINEHVEEEARVSLAFEPMSALPSSEFRPDLRFSNLYRSGLKREGEYIIGVTHEGDAHRYLNYRYAERFLEPVYSVTVEGVPILKVWKNDEEHTRPEYLTRVVDIKGIHTKVVGSTLHVEFPQVVRLVQLHILFKEEMCDLPAQGRLFISLNGHSWSEPFPGTLLESSSYHWLKPHNARGKLFYIFADDKAKFLRITNNNETSCLRKYPVSVHAKGVE